MKTSYVLQVQGVVRRDKHGMVIGCSTRVQNEESNWRSAYVYLLLFLREEPIYVNIIKMLEKKVKQEAANETKSLGEYCNMVVAVSL